ncbi:hypothetical protein ACN20G_16420 [Streptomyces sp. BI20]|uniref:hypothetical protein n=1 Tax=Streptomyces sp. BI20 TaxID=3403460 RepID=UPI003C78A97B
MTVTTPDGTANPPQPRPVRLVGPPPRPSEAPVVTSPATVSADVEIALSLSVHCPAGPAAETVRQRLRVHVGALADAADAYARSLGDCRARDIALDTVRHARKVAEDRGLDPAINLRLLAKSAEYVARYAAQARTT